MKSLKIFLFLSLSFQLSFAQNTESDKVNQLHKNKFTWLVNKSEDSLISILDDSVKYIHSNGWIQNKNQLLDDLRTGKLVYLGIEVLTSDVTIYGETAIVIGKGNFKGLLPNKAEFSMMLLYTEVYVKAKKGWKLVSRHACKI